MNLISMLKTKGIHHLALTVSDLQKSKEFYFKVCGMKVFHENKESVGLTSEGLDSLWLLLPRDAPYEAKPFNRNNVGLDHWAFSVTSLEDLKGVEKHLKDLGIEMEDGGITDDDFGGTAIFTQDPDGMKVEFHLVKE